MYYGKGMPFKAFFICLLTLNAPFAFSADYEPLQDAVKTPSDFSWVTTISVGPVWESAGQTQTFTLAPGIEKTYKANGSTDSLAVGEIFLGIQDSLSERIYGQLGLAVATTANATLTGQIWDDASPEFYNYNYRYKVKHTHIALKSKLLGDAHYGLMPWISASVGVGFNTARDFTNTPNTFEAVTTPNFSSNTETALTYTLGIGAQYDLTQNWQVGLGYEFADWGKSELGRALEQTENEGIGMSHLYTRGFLVNLTYLIPGA